jgi:hypothetical protein
VNAENFSPHQRLPTGQQSCGTQKSLNKAEAYRITGSSILEKIEVKENGE